MNTALGVRFPEELLKELDEIAMSEHVDKSTIIRKFVAEHLKEYKLEKAVEKYRHGKLSLSGVARKTGLTVHEVLDYLRLKGYKSEYSIGDLERELDLLK